jgi:hypothetical protein
MMPRSAVTRSETSRKIRAALKSAFPDTKFAVALSAGCSITWTDEGPSVVQVEDALLAAGCGEAVTSGNDKRYIRIDTDRNNDTLHFDRYNVAERTAYQQDLEHRTQKQAARQQREDAAVKQALQTKRAAIEPLKDYTPPPIRDTMVFEALERLRQRAEAEVTIAEDAERRPSWAPPLVLGHELAEVCFELGYLTEHDKLIGRLWATFATPKRSGRYLREHVSRLPLHGIQCRDFQLYAGGTRGSRTALLFEAQRLASGDWRFGPREWLSEYSSPRRHDWERLIRERERLRHELEHWCLSEGRRLQVETRLTEIAHQIEAIDTQDAADANEHRKHKSLRQQALELARARVLDFIGAPDAQMQLAARLCGHCCICFKELTDPISLERGIGPDCLQRRVEFIKRSAQGGRSLEYIVMWSGMPLDFVTSVLSEEARHA